MSTREDWIRIGLPDEVVRKARIVAEQRQANAVRLHIPVAGVSSLETHILGAQGESAMRLYLGLPLETSAVSVTREKQRGGDIPGWGEVRTRSRVGYGLGLHGKDKPARFGLVMGHEAPVMWLAGWIDYGDAMKVATRRVTNGHVWYLVEQRHLAPFVETDSYRRASAAGPMVRALWEENPFFFCEQCNGQHRLSEMCS
jgi:hypothetical protein